MEEFEQVLEQYEPMISSILRKAHVYKNYEHYRQTARIALWQAWQKYEPTRGHFAPYAYRTMLTVIYEEMRKDNQHTEHYKPYENDKLAAAQKYMEIKHMPYDHAATFEMLDDYLTAEEFELLKDLYYYQHKYEELTEKYGASVAALKKRRDRLLKKLRIELKR